MKRTKQAYFKQHPEWVERETVSGCREFDGQDLKYDSRKEFFKNKQKQWLDQQIQQKKQKEERQKHEQMLYAQQTFQHTRMRGLLQDNFHKTKQNMVAQLKSENKNLELERKEKQKAERQARLRFEQQQAAHSKIRGQKQQFHMDVK